MIACEQLGRKCYAMEIEPKYCDVVVSRWETYTGKKAERIRPLETAESKSPGGREDEPPSDRGDLIHTPRAFRDRVTGGSSD